MADSPRGRSIGLLDDGTAGVAAGDQPAWAVHLAGLQGAGQVTTPTAWVGVPDLGVTRVDQTYRRLPDVDGLEAWEYGDPQHGPFRRTVDTDGLVVTYEGFARRVAATP
jgi:hypothetical protein